MAEVKKNLFTQGLSGMVGDTIVFRSVEGKTVVSAAPQQSEKEPSEEQKAHRTRFQEAILYAKHSLDDPAKKAAYDAVASGRPRISGYNLAVADFLKAPDIQEIDISGYAGHAGDSIVIRVTDDFKVEKVTVEILNMNGSLIEQGEAVDSDGIRWIYTAKSENMDIAGDKIVVKAFDLPGNVSENSENS